MTGPKAQKVFEEMEGIESLPDLDLLDHFC